jgi:hypothetical protein
MTLDLAGTRDKDNKLNLNGALRDTFNHPAAQLNVNEINGKINGLS